MSFAATLSVNHRAAFAVLLFACVVVADVNASAAEPPPSRRWTDAASGRTLEAEFLGRSRRRC